MISVFLLLLLTCNSLALDEEQRQFIVGTIQELSRKAANGEAIPADNPFSVFLLNVKTEGDDSAEQFPGHPVVHFLSTGLSSFSSIFSCLFLNTGSLFDQDARKE